MMTSRIENTATARTDGPCSLGRLLRSAGRALGAAASRLVVVLLVGCAAAAGGPVESGGTAANAADPLAQISAEQLFTQGVALAESGDVLRAEEYLSAAMERGYPQAQVLPVLLRVCLAASRLGAALSYAKPYLQLHPDDYQLRYLVAAVQFGLGRPGEAQRELERVLKQQPDFAQAHYMLAVILRDHVDDLDGATAHFRRHQALDPSGVHGAEVAAWLAEHADASDASVPSGTGAGTAPSTDSPAAAERATPTEPTP